MYLDFTMEIQGVMKLEVRFHHRCPDSDQKMS